MKRLSKQEMKAHQEAEGLVELDRALTDDEQEFVLSNWRSDARHMNSPGGAFFTPEPLAREVAIHTPDSGVVVDIGAGIGRLARSVVDANAWQGDVKVVCVELNPDYVEVGKRTVPEADWVQGSYTDPEVWCGIESRHGKVSCLVGNPPFGKLNGVFEWYGYRGTGEMAACAIALDLAACGGTFIIPQMSCTFKYSGLQTYEVQHVDEWEKIRGIWPDALMESVSVDTSIYDGEWQCKVPAVEIVDVRIGP